jgi:hypothetical protein
LEKAEDSEKTAAYMIAGHQTVGKKLITLALALLVVMIVISALVGTRKKTAPAKEPPLHPSTLVLELTRV